MSVDTLIRGPEFESWHSDHSKVKPEQKFFSAQA